MAEPGSEGVPQLIKWSSDFSGVVQNNLNRLVPRPMLRSLGTLSVAILYVLRVYYAQGFYIVSYGLGIYILNLLIGFLSPRVDPEFESVNGPSLLTKTSDEFNPFVRRLLEFKFC